jgi:hypothetical protein
MKRSVALAAALAASLATAVAHADVIIGFTGPYDPASWVTSVMGDLQGGSSGSSLMTSASLTLVGGDSALGCVGGAFQVIGPCEISVVTTVANPFVFDFDYSTLDSAGPAGDIFGVIVDGVHIALSDPGGPNAQTGHRQFAATSSFGWFINCTDCTGGAASTTIGDFATVPEPGSVALLGLAAVAWGVARRRRGAQ